MSDHTIKVAADCAPALEAMRKFRAIYYPKQPLPKLSEIAKVPRVKFTFDETYGVMYIYFDHPDAEQSNSVKKTIVNYWPGVNLDIGHDDEPVGLEFMSVKHIEGKE